MDQHITGENVGIVIGVREPIVTVSGLCGGNVHEIVHFELGGFGQIIRLRDDKAQVMCFHKESPRLGSGVRLSGEYLHLHVCPHILGSMITPLGEHLAGEHTCTHEKVTYPIESAPLPLMRRRLITQTMHTGLALVDLLLPLGLGQRQLVVGDRKTGKSTFLTQVAKMQVSLGHMVVFAAIGKRSSEIKELFDLFCDEAIATHSVIVASAADDPASVVTITPHTAMAVAEYLRDLGHTVTVIFDDLSTHAKYYREVALLADTFPGRDSYPGDMFYVHARLLERAGNFSLPDGKEASITALPVAQTQEGELTSFIVSNLISITDGHLFFESSLFARGMRPAIHTALSVTRVGKQTQDSLARDITYQLTLLLSSYEKTRNLTHFGAELTEETKDILHRGELFLAMCNQAKAQSIPHSVQIVLAALILERMFMSISIDEMNNVRDRLLSAYERETRVRTLLDTLAKKKNYEELRVVLQEANEQLQNTYSDKKNQENVKEDKNKGQNTQ
ncbi:hypothetical protein C5B42_03320 [Candidatus Cerribacteria bacterium 'Amazon FNV 2010 28 9']|uniref:ATPase F1/V1/A1 complex alpha/beta subunit nucleotide-binding domain-containing protein n=1 Tax=Candidatus Cerribacteria bacterium 'Amazon FNV 2010 28 9' TaxID=2081795 RepID=A0A317JPQ2_9BACT|nr:MAG: hypothetical protein C5B42_03320 [Candidatus Cerribacteria bacterium 'Amazon FNV 2010 28 9']